MHNQIEYLYYVYILASSRNGTLYVGFTNDLRKRMAEHRYGYGSRFTNQYRVHALVYFEETSDVKSALLREKQLKKWNRSWKIRLIEEINPKWEDLFKPI